MGGKQQPNKLWGIRVTLLLLRHLGVWWVVALAVIARADGRSDPAASMGVLNWIASLRSQ